MTVNELINYLKDISKDSNGESLVAVDISINGDKSTRAEISNIKVYGSSNESGKDLITLEVGLNVLGTVDTSVLVNKKINELIDAANDADDGILI